VVRAEKGGLTGKERARGSLERVSSRGTHSDERDPAGERGEDVHRGEVEVIGWGVKR